MKDAKEEGRGEEETYFKENMGELWGRNGVPRDMVELP
jgi:hypothetical protein